MIITKAKKLETGDWSFDLQLSNDEIEILVDFSIQTMLRQGYIMLTEQEHQQDIPLPGGNYASTGSVN